MRSAGFLFLVVAAVLIAGPYLLGIRPRSKRDWALIAVTIAFIILVLPMVVRLR